ncbi:MAG: hypothetical protein HY064_15440 [Bacteroidetes bacterium]|nr:hypothetical protein [Bacteroidota bacterium]
MKRILILMFAGLAGVTFEFCNHKEGNVTKLSGNGLDLYAVMNLFRTSRDPAEFEKSLNTKSNHINNLDLNQDGKVDYIRVIDKRKEKDHAIILRVPLNEKQSQDVAVIETEKTGDKEVHIQIVGDENLYGKEYIVQPSEKSKGTAGFAYASASIIVNVWYWPCIAFIYSPDYVLWESPWYWDYYPDWWIPWEPVSFGIYYPYVFDYHEQYVRVYENYFPDCEMLYYPYRRRVDPRYFENRNYSVEKNNGGGRREGEVNKPEKIFDHNVPMEKNTGREHPVKSNDQKITRSYSSPPRGYPSKQNNREPEFTRSNARHENYEPMHYPAQRNSGPVRMSSGETGNNRQVQPKMPAGSPPPAFHKPSDIRKGGH